MREAAPELLQTAKTQRWAPQELLQTLVREETPRARHSTSAPA